MAHSIQEIEGRFEIINDFDLLALLILAFEVDSRCRGKYFALQPFLICTRLRKSWRRS